MTTSSTARISHSAKSRRLFPTGTGVSPRAAAGGRAGSPSPLEGEPTTTWAGRPEGLTGRESEILGLVVCAMSNREIAGHLDLSVNSVKSYIRSAYRKVGVSSRSQAVFWALEHGFHVQHQQPERISGRIVI